MPLSYTPSVGSPASTCHQQLLYVVEDGGANLHTHNMETGEQVTSLSQHQLGLTEEEKIWEIGLGDGGWLHVAVGRDQYNINRVNTYKVKVIDLL